MVLDDWEYDAVLCSTGTPSKCKKPYHLRAWLKKHENLAKEKGLKAEEKLGCLNIRRKPGRCCLPSDVRNFFSEKCVPSLVTSLQKISSTGAENSCY